MQIDGRHIGPGHPPYVIAEVSGEHLGMESRAHMLMREAARAGASAVKFQCFDPDRLAESRGGRDKVLTEGLWAGYTLGDLYRKTHTPREWFPGLFDAAKAYGITMFSSVFDEEGVEYLDALGCPAIKIASFELTDLALIRKAASTGKPLILSTGMAKAQDVAEAFEASAWKREAGWAWHSVAVLHCVSAYPCRIEDAHLTRVKELADNYGVVGGLSDHTLGSIAPVVATALGASIIEKHITLDRKNGGPDAPFSLEPHEFKQMVQDVKDAYASLGTGDRPASEDIYRDLRRKG